MVLPTRRHRKRHAGLMITPLIDVVFILLMFILLCAHFRQDQALDIVLPQAASSARVEKTTRHVVAITRDMKILYENTPMDMNTFREYFKFPPSAASQDTINIKADKDVPVWVLVSVMDTLRTAGVCSISMETVQPSIAGNTTLP